MLANRVVVGVHAPLLNRTPLAVRPAALRHIATPSQQQQQQQQQHASPVVASAAQPSQPATVAADGVRLSSNQDVQGDMLKPSVVNTALVRTLAPFAVVAVAASSSAWAPSNAAAFVHIGAYGLWFGSNIFNTFFVGLTMFKNMPRQMFGRVQSVLFPKYFALTTGCNLVLLASLLLSPSAATNPPTAAAAVLGVGLACSALNYIAIEPVATKLMFQRYDIENKENKTEEDKANIQSLYKQFGKYHGISSLLNLIITCTAVAHGWYLGGKLML